MILDVIGLGGLIIVSSGLIVYGILTVLGKMSKKGQAIGLIKGKLAPCPNRPNCVSSEDGTPETHKVAPFKITDLRVMRSAVTASRGKITKEKQGYFSATFTSTLFGFVDDFEAYDNGDVIHVRSASRVGYSDSGTNRKRVEGLRVLIDTVGM